MLVNQSTEKIRVNKDNFLEISKKSVIIKLD